MVAASETKEEEGEHIQAVTEPPGPAASAAHAAPAARASGLSIALHVPLSVVVVLVAVISVAIAVALTRDDDGGGGASTLTVATDGVQERRASAMPTPSPTTPSSSPTVPPSELSIVWQPEDFQSEDPFVAAPVTPWETTGSGGLTLAIVNAMDEEWQALFGIVVQEWDSGVPDALTLLTTRVTPDSACVTEFGVFKLCNGDYGGTGWRGVVVHVMDDDDDFVVAAVGKLNDFYLPDSDADDQAFRRYTLCHEVRMYRCERERERLARVWVHLADTPLSRLPLFFHRWAMDLACPTRTKTFTMRIWAIAWTTPTTPR
jgi:hypothetical protein